MQLTALVALVDCSLQQVERKFNKQNWKKIWKRKYI